MFQHSQPFSGFSVDDIDAARRFYTDTLELEVADDHGMLQLRIRPDVSVLVYPVETHRPGSYTVLNFPVDDIDAAVDELTRRGVTFERYEGAPQDDKGIVRGRSQQLGPDIAWFTDPAGNVLSVLQQ